jgi:hypothetical protein
MAHTGRGFLPEESSGAQESHEAVCILNTSTGEAQLLVSFYFEDREPIKNVGVTVPPERTLHVTLGSPRATRWRFDSQGHALRDASGEQCAGCDPALPPSTSQEALTLMTTMAYPVR